MVIVPSGVPSFQSGIYWYIPGQSWGVAISNQFFKSVIRAFKSHKVPMTIVGGYAVVLHGVVRGTLDVDAVIAHSKQSFLSAEKALNSIGLESRLPLKAEEVFQFREEYIQNRHLIAWSFHNPQNPLEVVDIVLTHDQKNVGSVKRTYDGVGFSIASLDSLIAMKKQSNRPQDREDVAALKKIKKS